MHLLNRGYGRYIGSPVMRGGISFTAVRPMKLMDQPVEDVTRPLRSFGQSRIVASEADLGGLGAPGPCCRPGGQWLVLICF